MKMFKIINFFRIWLLRLKGVKVGQNVKIYKYCNIYGKGIEIGQNTLIGSYVTIQDNVKVGENCRIGDYTFLAAGTQIEDYCFLSQHVSICNDKYPKALNADWKRERVLINESSSIGSGAVLLPGIEIGRRSLIGAGSVVTKSTVEDSVYVGNPAKKKKFDI